MSPLRATLLAAAMLALALHSSSAAASTSPDSNPEDSWEMTDRFYGFRYHIQLLDDASGAPMSDAEYGGMAASIQRKADELGCFGWVQRPSGGQAVVGEVRCGKKKGLEIKQWLQSSGSGIAHRPLHGVDVKVYPDTKIRLHFATFKLLPEERDTCFLDPPHQCAGAAGSLDEDQRQLLRQAGAAAAAKEEL